MFIKVGTNGKAQVVNKHMTPDCMVLTGCKENINTQLHIVNTLIILCIILSVLKPVEAHFKSNATKKKNVLTVPFYFLIFLAEPHDMQGLSFPSRESKLCPLQ